jgi:sulfur transfer protein SufE
MQQGYVDTIRALSSEQMRKQVIADALRQLKGWQRRYRMIVELSRVAEAIDGALDEHDPDDR